MRKSKRRTGTLVARAKGFASWLVVSIGQPKDLVNLVARKIGDAAEVWITHYVEICESCEAQRLAQPAASRRLHVEDEVGVVPD